jgi:putative hydrolase of the HAD superfamily
MNQKYKHLFFDLDHTLWDTDANNAETVEDLFHTHIFPHVIKDVSFHDFYKVYYYENKRLWSAYNKNEVTKEELRWKRFYNALLSVGIDNQTLAAEIGELFVQQSPYKKALIAHTLELLEYLKEKYTMHIITNGFDEVQQIKMKESGLMPYFQEIITSEKAGKLKPDLKIFEYALALAGISSTQALMIGDSFEADILGASAANIDQVFYNPNKMQISFRPTFEIYSLLELKEIL